jgi:hypothetical protein
MALPPRALALPGNVAVLFAVNPLYEPPPPKDEESRIYRVRLVGLVFARSDRRFAMEEILPGLNYYHARSKENIDFRFAGYTKKNTPGRTAIGVINGRRWYFDPKLFDGDRIRIAGASTWKYSGETDLILLVERGGKLDWSTTLSANLEEWKEQKVIRSVSELIEKLCSIAESVAQDSQGLEIPVLSDALSFRGALDNLVRAFIPSGAADQLKKALLSVTRDLRKK